MDDQNTLGWLLAQAANRWPEKTFLYDENRSMTYSDLYSVAQTMAFRLMDSGVRPGDRVGVLLANSFELIASYFAIAMAGAVIVPLNTQYTLSEIEFILSHSETHTMISAVEFAQVLQPLVTRRDINAFYHGDNESITVQNYHTLQCGPLRELPKVLPSDMAIILYTSGTTGDPKGVMLSHWGVVENARLTQQAIGYREDDRALTLLPLFHSFGLSFDILQMVIAGGSTVILPRFETVKALELIQTFEVTVIAGVPTMFSYLFNHPLSRQYNLTSLRLGDVGGGPVPPTLKNYVEQRFGMALIESYGLTEISPVAAVERPNQDRRLGSCGTLLPTMSARVVDANRQLLPTGEIGELVIKSTTIMMGYWKNPTATARAVVDGWLYTGDLARMDGDRYLFIVDRAKDLIISGGYNIYPKEVESVIFSHPDVLQVAVVGIDDEVRGESVKAFIIRKPNTTVDSEGILQWCRERLAQFKIPRVIEFCDELPLTYSGKVRKFKLKEH